MPRPDTGVRKAAFEQRRRRYAERLRRRRKSYPYLDGDGRGDPYIHHKRGPYEFAGNGSTQVPLHQLVKFPTHGPPGSVPPFPITVTTPSRRHPPHVAYAADPGDGYPDHHTERAIANYHHRAQTYRGHKLGRFNGTQRRSYFAWRNAQKFHRENGYYAFPAWDPDGRLPVQP